MTTPDERPIYVEFKPVPLSGPEIADRAFSNIVPPLMIMFLIVIIATTAELNLEFPGFVSKPQIAVEALGLVLAVMTWLITFDNPFSHLIDSLRDEFDEHFHPFEDDDADYEVI